MGVHTVVVFSLLVAATADYKTACSNKVAGDACEYVSDQETQCSLLNGERFCRVIDSPGAKTVSACSIHSRQGYLGCFSQKEDAPVFQVCVGQTKGSECLYETAASTRGGGTPASNTSGHCIAHYDHQILMCLEAIGQPDDDECAGKGVGQPCTHSTSPNAVCAHHSRRGDWMCLAPKEESMVFVICQGSEPSTPCSYSSTGTHGTDSGLIQGQCCPHEKPDGTGHGGMMCIKPEHLGDACDEVSEQKQEEEEKSFSWIIALIIVASIVVLLSALIAIVVMIVKTRKRHASTDPSSGRTNPAFSVQVGVVGQPVNDTETATKA